MEDSVGVPAISACSNFLRIRPSSTITADRGATEGLRLFVGDVCHPEYASSTPNNGYQPEVPTTDELFLYFSHQVRSALHLYPCTRRMVSSHILTQDLQLDNGEDVHSLGQRTRRRNWWHGFRTLPS